MNRTVIGLTAVAFGIVILVFLGLANYTTVFDGGQDQEVNFVYSQPDMESSATIHQPHVMALESGDYVQVRIIEKEKPVYVDKVRTVEVPVEKVIVKTINTLEFEEWSRNQVRDRLYQMQEGQANNIEDNFRIEVN